jgi:hypothetical protein
MAHFAQIVNNTVTQVIVVSDDDAPGESVQASEKAGRAFIASLGLRGQWVQTSYNGRFRGSYAGIGYTWDPQQQMFIQPEPEPEVE